MGLDGLIQHSIYTLENLQSIREHPIILSKPLSLAKPSGKRIASTLASFTQYAIGPLVAPKQKKNH